MKDLGKVMITPKGSYNNDTKYEKLDLVEYNGSSYIALKDTTGNVPVSTSEFWQLHGKGNPSLKYTVTIPSSGWSEVYPFTNAVTVDGVTEDMDLQLVGINIPGEKTATEVRTINRAAGFLMSNDNGVTANTVTFLAYEKPTVDFSVTLCSV